VTELIKVENIEVWGFEHAIRGMRNPLNSWDKSDSVNCHEYGEDCDFCERNYSECAKYYIGENDLDLMQRLFKAGTEHRKYLRQIFVSMDITAPLYWWKEFSTYKIGTVENSCSTMHRIAAKEFEPDDFSHEHLTDGANDALCELITKLNLQRDLWNETKEKCYWWGMIQLLPSSYNQRRTVTMNYENVFTIIHQRTGHKLDEWNTFVRVLKTLPYVKDIAGYEE
jgi:hypothetical protein